MQTRTRKKRKPHIALKLLLLLLAAVIFVYAYSNLALTCSRYEVRNDKLPPSFDGFKILLISDLHGRCFGEDNSALISLIDSESPDAVMFAGDMVTYSADDIDVFLSLAQNLGERYDTYYIHGNHEGQLAQNIRADIDAQIAEFGVHVLDNSKAGITRGDANIDIYGLTLPGYMYSGTDENGEALYQPTPDWIEETLGSSPQDNTFSILLAHTPLYFDAYADWGADLVFSGHIHGGEIRIPFVGGVFSPHGELFPEYDAGEFRLGDSTAIISRGLGEHAFPVRFLNPADVCIITLRASD